MAASLNAVGQGAIITAFGWRDMFNVDIFEIK